MEVHPGGYYIAARGRGHAAANPALWLRCGDPFFPISSSFGTCSTKSKAQFPFYLTRLQQRLEAHGGRYFAADRLSVADLKVYVFIRHLRSGERDHVPSDLPDRVAPGLVEHY